MLSKFGRYFGIVFLLFCGVTFLAWLTSPDPKFNPASFEDAPFDQALVDPAEAITLAQYLDPNGETVTIMVVDYDGETVHGIDLADLGAPRSSDPFIALAAIDGTDIQAAISQQLETRQVEVSDLLPSGPTGDEHLGIGTNFPEHAEEAQSESVFNFPKFGTATPARTSVVAPEGGLLDYEVELCMRFDRSISSIEDFDAAVKGVFLCADFTDRIKLLKLADPDDLDSGYGFSDAKSGVGFFPTGPFLVVPNDWLSFIAETRMMTHLNGEPRQDARGEEMILDFRALTEKVLGDMDRARFSYQDAFYKLAPNARIEQDMTLMSGTSEGVIFTTPQRHDYIEIVIGYVLKGGPFSGKDLMDFAVEAFIQSESASGHFLQPGDVVTYRASGLGDIRVEITSPQSLSSSQAR
ncbi:MAG: fumarylacetoacetate hydrolase family protein [Pseudomonadota bacterium]